jgi:DNA-binding CsgD family transcriptional regulator
MGRVSVLNGGMDPQQLASADAPLARPPLPPSGSGSPTGRKGMPGSGKSVADQGQPRSTGLLGMENPARLSRAEFRVCLLLGRGLPPEAVARELQLSQATVRSHLHKIYAKTGSTTLADLVQRLQPIGQGPASLRAADA